jgi:ligand-binding sensor domain-containing protein
MLLTRDSHYLFFGSQDLQNPNQIRKFSVNKKEVVATFKSQAFEVGIDSIAISPDSNSIYVGTKDKLVQYSLKDGKVVQSRNINQRLDMKCACISAMMVTRNNQYLVTGTTYVRPPEKGTMEYLSGQELVNIGGPLCVWSTKDLTLVKS